MTTPKPQQDGPAAPRPADVLAARKRAGLTQTEAARVIYSTLRTWQDWESGARNCHPAMLELFQLKTTKGKRK
jgi:DNA (cytosine-5)-methyltransferase 1